MPAPLNVDREQVRMLVLAVGVREAARQCKLAEGTVLDWSRQGRWLADTKPTPAKLPPPASMVSPIAPISPADALANTLREKALETRLGLTKYAARMAKQADETGVLEEAPLYKAVADIHGKMHPETSQTGPTLNLLVMGGLDAE